MGHHTENPSLYPFLFRVCSVSPECWMEFGGPIGPHDQHGPDTFYVYICCYDYVHYRGEWAADAQIGKRPLTLDMDMVHEEHRFSTEQEALTFIKNWWKQQP